MIHNQQLFSSIFSATPFIFIIKLRKALHLAEAPKRVETAKGVYTARTVVLSTGANPRRLAVPGEEALAGRGVAYCATCDGMYYRGKEVAVLGGGTSAAEEALYLSKICPKV